MASRVTMRYTCISVVQRSVLTTCGIVQVRPRPACRYGRHGQPVRCDIEGCDAQEPVILLGDRRPPKPSDPGSLEQITHVIDVPPNAEPT